MTRESLKTKFATGCKPTGQDFASLIDSIPDNDKINNRTNAIAGNMISEVNLSKGEFDSLKERLNNIDGKITSLKNEVEEPLSVELVNFGNSFKVGMDSSEAKYDYLDNSSIDMKMEGQTLVNLLPKNPDFQNKGSTVTVDDEGFITIEGNGSYQNAFLRALDTIKPSAVYTLVLEVKNYTLEGTGSGFLYISSNQTATSQQFRSNTTYAGGKSGLYTYKLTSESTVTNTSISIRTFVNQNVTGGSVTYRMALIEGDHANKPLSYFEGLKSVGSEVELKQGKNLFDMDSYVTNTNLYVYGNKFYAKYSSGNSFIGVKQTLKYPSTKSKTFTISSNVEIGGCRTIICPYDADGNLLNETGTISLGTYNQYYVGYFIDMLDIGSRNYRTFTLGDKVAYFTLSFCNLHFCGEGKSSVFSDYQLEEGSVCTSYEPYKGEPLTKHKIDIVTTGKNLFNYELYPRNIGSVKVNLLNNGVQLTASRGSWSAQYFTFKAKPNTTYTFSMDEPIVKKGAWRVLIREAYDGELIGSTYATLQTEFQKTFTTSQKIGNGNFKVAIALYCSTSDTAIENVDVTYRNIQIEEDNQSTNFEPYISDKTEVLLNEPLRSLPNGIRDSIEIRSGKLIVTRRCKEIIMDGSESWELWKTKDNTIDFVNRTLFEDGKVNSDTSAITFNSDKFKPTKDDAQDNEFIKIHRAETFRWVMLCLSKGRFTTHDVATFKQWLSESNIRVVYELAEPVVEEFDMLSIIPHKNGSVFLETGVVHCSSTTQRVALNTKRQVDDVIADVGTNKLLLMDILARLEAGGL